MSKEIAHILSFSLSTVVLVSLVSTVLLWLMQCQIQCWGKIRHIRHSSFAKKSVPQPKQVERLQISSVSGWKISVCLFADSQGEWLDSVVHWKESSAGSFVVYILLPGLRRNGISAHTQTRTNVATWENVLPLLNTLCSQETWQAVRCTITER